MNTTLRPGDSVSEVYIVIVGNMVEGLTYYGAYPDRASAMAAGQILGAEWQVAALKIPSELTVPFTGDWTRIPRATSR